MILNNSQKAMSIALFIACILIVLLVNFSISLSKKIEKETFVEVVKLDPSKEEIEAETTKNNASKSTNQAYNTTKNQKHFAEAYKVIEPPKDYDNPLFKKYKEHTLPESKYEKSKGSSSIKNNNMTAYNGVESILTRHSNVNPENNGKDTANKNSTINYSLVERTDKYLPVPIYLCEAGGKIVINITVDSDGLVTKTSVNSSSSSKNKCLIEHALDYAKEARFDRSSKVSQLGSITFNFRGKK